MPQHVPYAAARVYAAARAYAAAPFPRNVTPGDTTRQSLARGDAETNLARSSERGFSTDGRSNAGSRPTEPLCVTLGDIDQGVGRAASAAGEAAAKR
jgi:hypothetical protein